MIFFLPVWLTGVQPGLDDQAGGGGEQEDGHAHCGCGHAGHWVIVSVLRVYIRTFWKYKDRCCKWLLKHRAAVAGGTDQSIKQQTFAVFSSTKCWGVWFLELTELTCWDLDCGIKQAIWEQQLRETWNQHLSLHFDMNHWSLWTAATGTKLSDLANYPTEKKQILTPNYVIMYSALYRHSERWLVGCIIKKNHKKKWK